MTLHPCRRRPARCYQPSDEGARQYNADRGERVDLQNRLINADAPTFGLRVLGHLKAQAGRRPTDYLKPSHLR